MMNLDLAQLNAHAAAVSEGTFDAAARALHITPSAVSQRIKALETAAGRILLTRSKPVQPTESGEVLLRLARQIGALTADVSRELGGDAALGVPLAVNGDSLATWFLPALAAVDPPLTFDLHRADQDLTANLLRRGSVMAAVTASAEPVAGCTVERLGRMRYRPSASRQFAARWFPDGPTAQALTQAPVVVFDRDDELQDRYLRRRTRRRVDPPRSYVPSTSDFFEAVRLGLGWGMIPDLQAAKYPNRGHITVIDEQGTFDVTLYWQRWRLQSRALQDVTAAVHAAAAAKLR